MPLSSTSTLAEVEAAFDDNASYEETADLAKCLAFQTAIKILMRRLPDESSTRESSTRWNTALLQKELDRAEKWQASQSGNSTAANAVPYVKRASFEYFRD